MYMDILFVKVKSIFRFFAYFFFTLENMWSFI